MGVDFYLCQIKRKKVAKSDVVLPEIEAHFAITEYPRFITQLATDAGIGELWSEYRAENKKVSRRIMDLLLTDSAADNPPRPIFKKKWWKLRRKQDKQQEEVSVDDDREVQALRNNIHNIAKNIEGLSKEQPLVEFLLAQTDCGAFDSAACGRIAPCIRAIADKWETAPEGWVGWREKALEIVEAMELAAKYPDVFFQISG